MNNLVKKWARIIQDNGHRYSDEQAEQVVRDLIKEADGVSLTCIPHPRVNWWKKLWSDKHKLRNINIRSGGIKPTSEKWPTEKE